MLKRDISKKLKLFYFSGTNLAAAALSRKIQCARMLEPGHPRPDRVRREGAPASWIGFLHRSDVALVTPFCLELFLDLVNDHPARLVVRERLRVIAVARVHPNA